MKRITMALLASSLLVLPIAANAHPDEDEDRDETPVTETYDFEDFDSVSVSGVYDVDIQVGKSYSIKLSGPAYEMNRIKVENDDGTLRLGSKKKKRLRGHRDGIEATITLPALTDVHVSGVASGDIKGVDSDRFELHVSGVAEVEIEGRCGRLEAHVSGVGELDAEKLKCEDADVHLSGVGEMSVYATEYADISASGVGEVDVYGDPKKVDKNKSLFTSINIK